MPLYTTVVAYRASAPSDSLFRAPCTNILTYLVLIRTYFLQWLQVFRLANLMNDNAVLRLAVYIRPEPNTPFYASHITGRGNHRPPVPRCPLDNGYANAFDSLRKLKFSKT